MEVISQEDARERGLKFFFTKEPCSKGHTDKRYVAGGACKTCRSLRHKGIKLPDAVEHPRTRAARLGETYYWTGKPCTRGHTDYRVTSGGACRSCSQENNKNLMDNPEKHQEMLQYSREYYKENKEHKSEYAKKYRKEVFEESGERLIKMRASRSASESKRRFMIRCSSSPHFEEEIGEIYYQAKLLQSKLEQCVVSDDPYDTVVNVDHIIPINNKYICGLHAPQNLRIIPARENFQKQATFHPYVEVYI